LLDYEALLRKFLHNYLERLPKISMMTPSLISIAPAPVEQTQSAMKSKTLRKIAISVTFMTLEIDRNGGLPDPKVTYTRFVRVSQ
jgi:hypothetical protein